MNLIEEINNQLEEKLKNAVNERLNDNTNTEAEIMQEEAIRIVVDYLNGLDFSNPEVKQQSLSYITKILDEKVKNNLEISPIEAVAMHCMYTKMSLAEKGHGNVKVNYRNREPGDNRGAYQTENNLTFYLDKICNKSEFLKSWGKPGNEQGGKSRLRYFNDQFIFVTEHEIQHIIQHHEILNKDMTNESFVMDRQFLLKNNTLFYKIDSNHDLFLFELNADINGRKEALKFLKENYPYGYELTQENGDKWNEKLEKKENDRDTYEAKKWNYYDNREFDINETTVKVIEEVFALIANDNAKTDEEKQQQRNELFKKYPSLNYTHNKNGTKKTYEEIMRDKDLKIKAIKRTYKDRKVRKEKIEEVEKLYETIIRTDKELADAEDTKEHNKSYKILTNAFPDESIPSPKVYVLNKNRVEPNKAGYLKMRDMYKEYKERYDAATAEEKKHMEKPENVLKAIDKLYFDARNTITPQDYKNHELATQKLDKEEARDVLKEAFPGFEPFDRTYNLTTNEFTNNSNEKLTITDEFFRYQELYNSATKEEKAKLPHPITVYKAIDTYYNFEVSNENYENYKTASKSGRLEKLQNAFEYQKEDKTKTKEEKNDVQSNKNIENEEEL